LLVSLSPLKEWIVNSTRAATGAPPVPHAAQTFKKNAPSRGRDAGDLNKRRRRSMSDTSRIFSRKADGIAAAAMLCLSAVAGVGVYTLVERDRGLADFKAVPQARQILERDRMNIPPGLFLAVASLGLSVTAGCRALRKSPASPQP
jgi:hypothetical protein